MANRHGQDGKRAPLNSAAQSIDVIGPVAIDAGFRERLEHVFPACETESWSMVDRVVFNHYMARLLEGQAAESISLTMLEEARAAMEGALGRLANAAGHENVGAISDRA